MFGGTINNTHVRWPTEPKIVVCVLTAPQTRRCPHLSHALFLRSFHIP